MVAKSCQRSPDSRFKALKNFGSIYTKKQSMKGEKRIKEKEEGRVDILAHLS